MSFFVTLVFLLPTQDKAPEKIKPPTKVEQELIKLTNQARTKANKPALVVNDLLMKAARQHAEHMARVEQMNHVLDNKTPEDRVKAVGYEFHALAENIAAGTRTPAEAINFWLNSERHRENILGDDYADLGVAQARSAKGIYYYVEVFAKKQ
jgi:uncharacterized protein YkwD